MCLIKYCARRQSFSAETIHSMFNGSITRINLSHESIAPNNSSTVPGSVFSGGSNVFSNCKACLTVRGFILARKTSSPISRTACFRVNFDCAYKRTSGILYIDQQNRSTSPINLSRLSSIYLPDFHLMLIHDCCSEQLLMIESNPMTY